MFICNFLPYSVRATTGALKAIIAKLLLNYCEIRYINQIGNYLPYNDNKNNSNQRSNLQ